MQGILLRSKYYTAIGSVVDAALARILEDVLALPDIPEVESNRLSELCRILHALEGLFMEDSNSVSAFGQSCLVRWYAEVLQATIHSRIRTFLAQVLVSFRATCEHLSESENPKAHRKK